ncbi:DUF2255 family protein [Streptomyces sp. NPDC097610]|uniref:DUF2255 family protein n=1 Tax=Streptomyces sp. NPDC097610 TaxID=3157227 RepID=UPI0033252C20
MTTTTAWSHDELDLVGAAQELRIASVRRDGSLSGGRTIWAVRPGDDIYVRSVNGPGSAWYRGTHVRREGRVKAGGVRKDVAFVDADQDLNTAVDTACGAKYGRYADYIIMAITSPEASSTTFRLVPRPADS